MKTTSNVLKVLTLLGGLAIITLFFFPFVNYVGEYTLTGFQVAFGSTQTTSAGEEVTTYKGAWYAFTFIISALSAVFSAYCFKKRGSGYASMAFSGIAMVAMIVFAANTSHVFDYRPLESPEIETQTAFWITLIVSIATFALSIASLLVADYVAVHGVKGAKPTIPRRIVNFFKDYKSEIKKIVWPSRQVVVKNTIIVLIMCVILGVYIAALDFGLAKLFGLVLGVDL